jgi:hypothetical protein
MMEIVVAMVARGSTGLRSDIVGERVTLALGTGKVILGSMAIHEGMEVLYRCYRDGSDSKANVLCTHRYLVG